MNYTKAINIPVTLNGKGIARSLQPALCWRPHTLYNGLFLRVLRDKCKQAKRYLIWPNIRFHQDKYF